MNAESGKEMEKKCEKWGENIEKKIGAFEKKLPKPANAFFDALCISVVIAGVAWLFVKFNWIGKMPSWTTLGIIFCALFVISLIYRLIIKK